MIVTAAGIDRIKIANADASGHGAQFVVWLYLQVDEGGTLTGQELVVSLPYDPTMTFDDLASQAFERATINAVSRWRYDPQVRNGEPVMFRGATTQLVYSLDG